MCQFQLNALFFKDIFVLFFSIISDVKFFIRISDYILFSGSLGARDNRVELGKLKGVYVCVNELFCINGQVGVALWVENKGVRLAVIV